MADKPKVLIPESKKKVHENIYAALSSFQGELKPMAKNGKVTFQTNGGKNVDFTYTPLGDIMAAIYPLLVKHGLSVRHELSEKGIEAILTHETFQMAIDATSEKETISEEGRLKVTDKVFAETRHNEIRSGVLKMSYGAQMKDTGANITYARRYTLTMVLGISSEDDKDAELLEQSAKNAIQTVYSRFKAGLENAKTVAEVEKSMVVLQKDLKNVENGKAAALGLSKEQLDELIKAGDARIDDIKANQDPKGGGQ